jgi:fatty acid desaturase
MRKADIPKRINVLLWALTASTMLCLLLMVPLFAAHYPYICLIIIILLIPVNTICWSLIHEGIHRNMHPDQKMNEFMARSLSIMLGNSFHVLRFGHMMHHQYNREWESEIYPADSNKLKATFNHYLKMLGGLYLIEVLLSYLVGISTVKYTNTIVNLIFSDEHRRQAVRQMLLKPSTVVKVRLDCLMITALYALSFYLYGMYWWLLAVIIAGRAVIISLMDNAYHYGTPLDNSVPAKELYIPAPLATMILNFNYHLTHHKNAGLSWRHLPQEHVKQNRSFDDHLIPALLDQFKGPLRK